MFRRALLAVAALSCTFSESNYVHSEKAQRLAIKDLICVLILSGGEKDDIGPNSQSKLHSPNLNIRVLNNESLHKKCLLNVSADGIDNKTLKTLLNSTSVELLIKQLKNVNFDDFYSKNVTNERYAVDQQGNTGTNVTMTRGRRTAIKDVTNSNIQESTTLLIQTVSDKDMNYPNEKPNLDKVITFWQTLAENSVKKLTADSSKDRDTNENERNKILKPQINVNPRKKKAEKFRNVINNYIDNKNRIEGEYLKNMLPEYISQRSVSTQTSLPTSSASYVTDDDTDIFKYLLDSRDKESLETHNINAHLSKYSYEFNFSKFKYENKKINHKNSFHEETKPNDMIFNDYENFKSNVTMRHKSERDGDDVNYDRVNSNYMRKIRNFNEPNSNFVNHLKNFKLNDTLRKLKTRNSKNKSENSERDSITMHRKQRTSTIPSDLIEQIAENVKALILKDLHKDVITTATSLLPTSTKGTTEASRSHNNPEKILEKPYILSQILEILQKYKNDGQTTVAYKTQNNLRDAQQTTPKIVYPLSLHNENYAITTKIDLPYLNSYYPFKTAPAKKVAARLDVEMPTLIPFIPVRHLPASITTFGTLKSFKSKPIMLQTNLLEIPPLGIAVLHPLSLVNHDLIVSTMRPFRQIPYKLPVRNSKSENKKSKMNKPKRNNRGTASSKKLKSNVYNKNNEKAEQKIIKHVRDDGTEDNSDMKTKRIHPKGYNRHRIQTENNVKRLREKLDYFQPKADYKKDKDGDCCKDEIFTKEYHPLDDIKMRDEASFKNLLRTQQRVTDMLALMLAKTKGEQPLSVETA